MNFGLGVNVNETIREVVEKSREAERQGLDYVWVADVPSQRYAFAVASAIAANTDRLRIGLGLLSVFLYKPEQIADGFSTLVQSYGDRFELCVGSGDRNQLKRVGVSLAKSHDIVNYVLDSKHKIERRLQKNGVRCKVWLGAQGPKMLGIARHFDGVLLNYSLPSMVKWALGKVGKVGRRRFELGLYAPSYVYMDFDKRVYDLLRVASAVVAVGSSRVVLKKLRILDEVAALRKRLKGVTLMETVVEEIPPEIVKAFSVSMTAQALESYMSAMSRLSVKHIAFGYPQNFSKTTIRDLARGLQLT